MSEPARGPVLPGPELLAAAREVVGRHHARTPLYEYAALSSADRRVLVKHENHARIRSFKGRGALATLAMLGAAARERGVVTASTGNHGQAIAWAGRILGVPATVVLPRGAAPVKREAVIEHGGSLVVAGDELEQAGSEAERISRSSGELLIEDGNDAGLMAGAATIATEILEELPDTDTIVVPVGGGNLIAGIALAARAVKPRIRIVGVQSDAAPAVALSFGRGEIVHAACRTAAGGLATTVPGELAFQAIRALVDEVVLVSERDLTLGTVVALRTTGQLVELAAAATFAAIERHPDAVGAGTAVLVMTGANIDPADLRDILETADLGPERPRR